MPPGVTCGAQRLFGGLVTHQPGNVFSVLVFFGGGVIWILYDPFAGQRSTAIARLTTLGGFEISTQCFFVGLREFRVFYLPILALK